MQKYIDSLKKFDTIIKAYGYNEWRTTTAQCINNKLVTYINPDGPMIIK
jgi:uncharacterized protein YutD